VAALRGRLAAIAMGVLARRASVLSCPVLSRRVLSSLRCLCTLPFALLCINATLT
jgi:hypothetical protein